MNKFSFCTLALGCLLTYTASGIECPSGEPFAGAVRQIKAGACEGQWGLDTFIGTFLPSNLPAEYQQEYYRVAGCMERKKDEKPCVAGKDTYRLVEIYSIWPD